MRAASPGRSGHRRSSSRSVDQRGLKIAGGDRRLRLPLHRCPRLVTDCIRPAVAGQGGDHLAGALDHDQGIPGPLGVAQTLGGGKSLLRALELPGEDGVGVELVASQAGQCGHGPAKHRHAAGLEATVKVAQRLVAVGLADGRHKLLVELSLGAAEARHRVVGQLLEQGPDRGRVALGPQPLGLDQDRMDGLQIMADRGRRRPGATRRRQRRGTDTLPASPIGADQQPTHNPDENQPDSRSSENPRRHSSPAASDGRGGRGGRRRRGLAHRLPLDLCRLRRRLVRISGGRQRELEDRRFRRHRLVDDRRRRELQRFGDRAGLEGRRLELRRPGRVPSRGRLRRRQQPPQLGRGPCALRRVAVQRGRQGSLEAGPVLYRRLWQADDGPVAVRLLELGAEQVADHERQRVEIGAAEIGRAHGVRTHQLRRRPAIAGLRPRAGNDTSPVRCGAVAGQQHRLVEGYQEVVGPQVEVGDAGRREAVDGIGHLAGDADAAPRWSVAQPAHRHCQLYHVHHKEGLVVGCKAVVDDRRHAARAAAACRLGRFQEGGAAGLGNRRGGRVHELDHDPPRARGVERTENGRVRRRPQDLFEPVVVENVASLAHLLRSGPRGSPGLHPEVPLRALLRTPPLPPSAPWRVPG